MTNAFSIKATDKAVTKTIEELQQDVTEIVQRAALEIHAQVVSNTPVQTGASRSGWSIVPVGGNAPSSPRFRGRAQPGTDALPIGSEINAGPATLAADQGTDIAYASKGLGAYWVANAVANNNYNIANVKAIDLGDVFPNRPSKRGKGFLQLSLNRAFNVLKGRYQ